MRITGVPEYDNDGGLTFYIYGIVQKTGHPKATGTYSCIKQIPIDNSNSSEGNYLNVSGDGNPKTDIRNIQIKWQTDAEGKNVYANSGRASAHKNDCDNKPLPHEKGCFSAEIAQVQSCKGDVYVDGVLNDATIQNLNLLGLRLLKLE